MRSIVSDYELRLLKDLPSALNLLAADGAWRPIAGGTDLMVLFNGGKLPYRRLFSIRDIAELKQIEVSDDHIAIGAAVTYTQLRQHPLLRSEFPLLYQAAGWVGGVANQNRGTLGGNIANASPAADSSPMLLVYDAALELASSAAIRTVPYSAFHVSYRQTLLRPDELIARILLPRNAQGTSQYARKVGTRKAQAISKVCFAASANYEAGRLSGVRLAAGSVAPVPMRCFETERCLENAELTDELIRTARETLRSEIQPITDIRSTDGYRSSVTSNLLSEFLGSLL